MPRSIRRPAQAWVHFAQTCVAATAVLAAACSDPTLGPRTPVAMSTSSPGSTIMVAPSGALRAPGTASAPMSLAMAVASAPEGATIRLASGTYETPGLTIERSLTLEPAPGATVDIEGNATIPADQWEQVGQLWRTPWTAAALTPASLDQATGRASIGVAAASATDSMQSVDLETVRQQQISMDSRALQPAASLASVGPSSFFVDSTEKWLYVGQDPAVHPIQAANPAIGIVIAAPNVTLGNVSVHDFASIGVRLARSYSTIQRSTFSRNGLIGLDINGVSHATIQHNTISSNGQVGIEVSHSSDLTIQYNNVSSNNTRNYSMSGAAAGIKGTDVSNVMVRGNWVESNESNGIWFDVSSSGITVAANTVLRNRAYGIYFELNNGPLIVGNVSHDNGQAGIGVHFTTNARIYNNTLVNNGTDLDVSASYYRSGHDIYHSIIANNIFWNSKSRMLVNYYRYNGCNRTPYSESDYNAYYRPSGSGARDVVNWCNWWMAHISTFRSGAGYEWHGQENNGGRDPYFVDVGGENYHLHWGSPAIGRGQGLPSDAAAALGVRAYTTTNIGALQSVQ